MAASTRNQSTSRSASVIHYGHLLWRSSSSFSRYFAWKNSAFYFGQPFSYVSAVKCGCLSTLLANLLVTKTSQKRKDSLRNRCRVISTSILSAGWCLCRLFCSELQSTCNLHTRLELTNQKRSWIYLIRKSGRLDTLFRLHLWWQVLQLLFCRFWRLHRRSHRWINHGSLIALLSKLFAGHHSSDGSFMI